MRPMTRRTALSSFGAAGAGTCLCGLGGGCATFTKVGATPVLAPEAYTIAARQLRIDLGRAPALACVGGAAKLLDPRLPTPIIVARTAEADYAAASLLCPHRGVEVEYQHEQQRFRCASLGHSTFGMDGTLKKGFARKGLAHYAARLDPAENRWLLVSW